MIVFSEPKLLPLIPLLPTTPAKGAVIVLVDNLAIISPFLTVLLKLMGSSSSFFLILYDEVLLLKEVQLLSRDSLKL